MFRSMVITSGFSDSDSAIASRPSLAWPTTWSCSSPLKMDSRTFRMNAESSTTSTRNFFAVLLTMGLLTNRHDWSRRLRSDQFFERREELIFLHRLREESGSPFLHRAITVFCARARGDNHHRNPFGRGALAELGHQFIARHARHFEVGDHEMAALLCNEFGRLKSVCRQINPVSVLFKHAPDELPHADRVIRDHNDALLVNAINGVAWNRASRHRRGTGRKHPRSAGAGLQSAPFVRFCRDHTIQIDEENQAAIGGDGGAREQLHAPQIFAQIFDDDFVLAEDLFHYQSDLSASSVRDHHAEIPVDRFKGRQPEIGVDANDLCDDVADLGQQLSADVLNFVGPQPANFLDHCKPQRTNSAGEMMRVRGTFRMNFAPWPGTLCTSISPFSVFRLERTTSRPTPRPASSVLTEAVEKPGWNNISRKSRSVRRSAVWLETSPHSIALCRTRA